MALLATFADQAVIAIQNARLFNETQDALDRQTATADVLKVISESPTDVQPVFEAIAERARTLCDAKVSGVTRFDGEWVHLVAYRGASRESEDAMRSVFPVKADGTTLTGRAIRERMPVQIADVLAEPSYGPKEAARLAGFRANLAVPMMREGHVVGAISVCRAEAGPYPEKQVQLLQTFADQAVIAIENVRLFNETKEALERQTATAEILDVISGSWPTHRRCSRRSSTTASACSTTSRWSCCGRATAIDGRRRDRGRVPDRDQARRQPVRPGGQLPGAGVRNGPDAARTRLDGHRTAREGTAHPRLERHDGVVDGADGPRRRVHRRAGVRRHAGPFRDAEIALPSPSPTRR